MNMTPIKETIVCIIENVFIFSFKTQTASNTVRSGPKFKKMDTLTIGSERIHTKIIIIIKQIWPSPTMNVFLLSCANGAVRLVITEVLVIFAATGVSKMQQIRASSVTSKKGDTVGSIVFSTFISIKFVLKQTVESSAFIAA